MAKAGRDTQEWRILRRQCFERDRRLDAPCWICGEPIDYSLGQSTTRESYEADHYLDVKNHPELAHEPTNIRPSHVKCNRSRKTKSGIDELGNRSRVW